MERDGEVDADFLTCAGHHRHHPTGRKRDATLGQGEAFAIHHQLERIAHVVEIVERFAHAHHHDVGEQASIGGIGAGGFGIVIVEIEPGHGADPGVAGALGPFAQRIAREHDLPDDLARCQVAHEAHRAGVAEAAVECAADLARHAQGAAIGVGDEHHFEVVLVRRAQQPFAGAVGGDLRLHDLGTTDHEAFGEPGAHCLGDIGHRFEFGDAAMVEPVVHLLGAQLGGLGIEPGLREQFHDALLGQADQIDAAIFARSDAINKAGARHGNGIGVAGDRHQRGVHGRHIRISRLRRKCARIGRSLHAGQIGQGGPFCVRFNAM